MAAQPERHLRIADPDTGEVFATEAEKRLQARVDKLEADRKNLEKDIRSKRRQLTELQRNKARERIDYERYKDVERIATYWHKKCRGGNARVNPMSPERFDAVRGVLEQERIVVDEETGKKRREPMYTMEFCKRVVDGGHFDHFTKPRKNGTIQHFDDLELLFRDGKHAEEFAARCPS